MAIEIVEILDSKNDRVFCKLKHSGATLQAYVHGDKDSVSKKLGEEIIVEMSFEQLLSAELIHNFNDCNSDIEQTKNTKEYTIWGRVSGVISDTEITYNVFDIYIQKGPEFLAINSGDWGITPKVGDGVKVVVSELCFYNKRI